MRGTRGFSGLRRGELGVVVSHPSAKGADGWGTGHLRWGQRPSARRTDVGGIPGLKIQTRGTRPPAVGPTATCGGASGLRPEELTLVVSLV